MSLGSELLKGIDQGISNWVNHADDPSLRTINFAMGVAAGSFVLAKVAEVAADRMSERDSAGAAIGRTGLRTLHYAALYEGVVATWLTGVFMGDDKSNMRRVQQAKYAPSGGPPHDNMVIGARGH